MGELFGGGRDRVGLASILQLVEAEGLDGWLVLEPGGRLGFSSGAVCAAECGDLTGRDAVRGLFLTEGGRFAFHDTEPPHGAPLGSLIALIMDGLRLSDEWNRLAPLCLRPAPGAELNGPLQDLAGALDGARTLFEALERAQVAVPLVVDGLLEALERGHLDEAAPADPDRVAELRSKREPEPEPEPEPDPLEGLDAFELLDLGRSRIKARDFDGAVAAFERAHDLRPEDRIVRQNLKHAMRLAR